MTTRYAIWVKDTSGSRVAALDAFAFLQYTRRLNDRDTYELHLSAERAVDREKAALFVLDSQVEVYRKPDGQTWVMDLEVLHRKPRTWADDRGQLYWSSVGRGYEDLLRRRRVVPNPGQSHYSSSGAADDVLKDFVYDQAAGGAASARQFSGLTVASDASEGPSLDWKSRYGNLLEECKKIAESARGLGTPIWFEVTGTGAATFEFQAGAAPYGTDRRDTLTFTHLQGNLVVPDYEVDRLEEENYLYVAGQGKGAYRDIEEVDDSDSADDSPWNRCEGFVDARDLGSSAELQDRGQQRLSELGAEETLTFEVAQVPNCRYGVHWSLGDWATARFLDQEVDFEIVAVTVTLSGRQGETVNAEFRVL